MYHTSITYAPLHPFVYLSAVYLTSQPLNDHLSLPSIHPSNHLPSLIDPATHLSTQILTHPYSLSFHLSNCLAINRLIDPSIHQFI